MKSAVFGAVAFGSGVLACWLAMRRVAPSADSTPAEAQDAGPKESGSEEEEKLYMVIERFKNRDPAPVYARFREKGRLMPAGVAYVGSWVESPDSATGLGLARCWQVMATKDRSLLDEWIDNWKDLTDFDVFPVLTSAQAAAANSASKSA